MFSVELERGHQSLAELKLYWALPACEASACLDGWEVEVQSVGTTVCTGPSKLCGKAEGWGESLSQLTFLLSAFPCQIRTDRGSPHHRHLRGMTCL